MLATHFKTLERSQENTSVSQTQPWATYLQCLGQNTLKSCRPSLSTNSEFSRGIFWPFAIQHFDRKESLLFMFWRCCGLRLVCGYKTCLSAFFHIPDYRTGPCFTPGQQPDVPGAAYRHCVYEDPVLCHHWTGLGATLWDVSSPPQPCRRASSPTSHWSLPRWVSLPVCTESPTQLSGVLSLLWGESALVDRSLLKAVSKRALSSPDDRAPWLDGLSSGHFHDIVQRQRREMRLEI